MSVSNTRPRIAVLGASGYTGADLLRLLAMHGGVECGILTANSHAGKEVGQVFPHLGGLSLPPLIKAEDADWDQVDAVFCGLPHGTTQEIVAGLPQRLKVIDLSADFRLDDVETYAKWYGHPHYAPHLQTEAIYGLTEHNRQAIRQSRLVACPGCYPTAALLPLLPLVAGGLIEADDIVIDAKSGVSGAGRAAKQAMLFAEVAEGIHAYGVASHRHGPEIDQELTKAAGRSLTVNFTPHLMPMNRGLMTTCYLRLATGQRVEDLRVALERAYEDEPFVRVLPEGALPATRHVRGSNHCLIGLAADRIAGRAIVVAVIDNLVKGASGQAIQNFNLMFDLPETSGLEQQPIFP